VCKELVLKLMVATGVNLSKILGETKILWEQRVVITDESIGISQLLGEHARAAPQI